MKSAGKASSSSLISKWIKNLSTGHAATLEPAVKHLGGSHPQCDGMVRWSMPSNRKMATSINLSTGELAV
jgi:hypothetical protein